MEKSNNAVQLKKGHDYEYKRIPNNKISTDPTYQRKQSNAKISKLFKSFNPDLFDAPKVSYRKEEDKFYSFDGNHRVSLHRKIYGDGALVECKVYYGLTWEEEKDLFVAQNGIHGDPTTGEKMRAEYNAENSEVRGMVFACEMAGITVDWENKAGAYSCGAVSSLFAAYKMVGSAALIEILGILSSAFGGDKSAFCGGFIKGMASFYKDYEGDFNKDKLKKSLSVHTADWYLREARDMNGQMANRFEKLIVRAYNFNRKNGTRLEEKL